MKKLLITAFEPFGGSSRNASSEVLKRLPAELDGCTVEKLLLPVVFQAAAETALRRPADCIFLLGEAGGRPTVTPEVKAVNLRNARIPDNAGRQPENEKILPEGPDEYRTAVPVVRITESMQAEGIPIAVSEDAGAYVCNDTFYLTGIRASVPVEFIHVPAEPDRADEFAETVRNYIERALKSLNLIK